MNYELQKIQKALKSVMKSKRATYQSLAKALKVSSATIKRRLNGHDLTLQQLKDFAEALSISFYELIELSKEISREPHLFTDVQEGLLASDLQLMKIFRLILAGQSYSKILTLLKCTEGALRKAMRDLEKVGLAQLLPGDRMVPLVNFPFRWQLNGKLEKTYSSLILTNLTQRIARDKGHAGLNKKFEFALSNDAYQSFCREIENTFVKYRNLSEIHLSSQIDLGNTISGIFFLDQFSFWETTN